MQSSTVNTTAWNELALTIDRLITADPIGGLFTIVITTSIFLILAIIAVWAVVRIMRARKEEPKPLGDILDREKFAYNILQLSEEMAKITAEGRRLSSKHERIREHNIVRDQMTLVDSTIGFVESILIIKMSDKIRQMNPHYSGSAADFPAFRSFEQAIKYVLREYVSMFRRIAKENHLADRTEQEFFQYIGQKLENMKVTGRKLFESVYSSDVLPLSILMEEYDRDWKEIEVKYKDTLIGMREIASRYIEIMNKEEEDYQNRWNLFMVRIPEILQKNVIIEKKK